MEDVTGGIGQSTLGINSSDVTVITRIGWRDGGEWHGDGVPDCLPMMSKVSDDFGVWKLESGAWLIVNMEKEINPLQWNRP